MQGAGSNPNTGITAHTTPAIQQDHPANKRGGRQHADGKSVTPPPFHHYAAHHRNTRPTIHNGPHHHHDEGEDEQRIPHHTMSEERYSPPAQCGTQQGTVHGTTVQYSQYALGSRRHRPHTLDWGRPVAAHPTAIPHGTQTRRMDTIHSHTVHVHTLNDQR